MARRPPLFYAPHRSTSGVAAASSSGVLATANASANTKGNYAALIAALGFSANGFWLMPGTSNTANCDFLFDISADGGTTNIITNIPHSSGSSSHASGIYVPMRLPAGAAISARCQATTGGAVAGMGIIPMQSGSVGIPQLNTATTYGAATADSGGTSIDPGAVLNTEGSLVEISAATTRPIKYLVACFGNQINSARTTANWLVDIAIGTTVVVPDIWIRAADTSDEITPSYFGMWVDIPAGSQLQVRAQCSITDATDRLFDVILIGFD